MSSWNESDLMGMFRSSGFSVQSHKLTGMENRFVTTEGLDRWLDKSYVPAWRQLGTVVDRDGIGSHLAATCANRFVAWRQVVMVISCTPAVD